jgi:hypothetical protein
MSSTKPGLSHEAQAGRSGYCANGWKSSRQYGILEHCVRDIVAYK